MDFIKKFLSGKGVGYYLTLPALIFGILAIVMYGRTGITDFNTQLSTSALVCGWIGVGLLAVSLVIEFRPVKYVAYLLFLYAFFAYIQTQATYIANVFVSIDGNTFTSGFIATVVFYVLSFVVTLFAAVLSSWRPWAKKNGEAA